MSWFLLVAIAVAHARVYPRQNVCQLSSFVINRFDLRLDAMPLMIVVSLEFVRKNVPSDSLIV